MAGRAVRPGGILNRRSKQAVAPTAAPLKKTIVRFGRLLAILAVLFAIALPSNRAEMKSLDGSNPLRSASEDSFLDLRADLLDASLDIGRSLSDRPRRIMTLRQLESHARLELPSP